MWRTSKFTTNDHEIKSEILAQGYTNRLIPAGFDFEFFDL